MTKEKVLIVDDEKLIRWYLRENMEKSGFIVIEAEKGNEAIKIFSEHLPDIVLLDVNLPDISGIDVLSTIEGIDIEEVEKALLKKALEMARGNQTKAAKLLNLGRDAFRYRIQKFGLNGE